MKEYLNKSWLKKMYIDNELSVSSIASLCHVNQSLISRYLIRFEIPRRKFCGRPGIYAAQWKGGRTKSKSGYIWIRLKPGETHLRQISKLHRYVPEQILVVEKYIKRKLNKYEIIHHINEIKEDNRIKNLYLFPNDSEHQRYHQKLRKGSGIRITKSNLLSKYG